MKITAEPRSDQWNADDFIGGPRVFTIAGVKKGAAEQKYDIELVEGEGRVWRPPRTVLRLLMEAWGDDAPPWTGRRVELCRDPEVMYGGVAVGGIRVARMTDLPGGKAFRTLITVARGKKKWFEVEPLVDAPAKPTIAAEQVAASTDKAELRGWWQAADEATRALIQTRVAELDAQVES